MTRDFTVLCRQETRSESTIQHTASFEETGFAASTERMEPAVHERLCVVRSAFIVGKHSRSFITALGHQLRCIHIGIRQNILCIERTSTEDIGAGIGNFTIDKHSILVARITHYDRSGHCFISCASEMFWPKNTSLFTVRLCCIT